eukprot:COSAG01_NODE_64_length_29509_cov_1035.985209_10_plen_76_part_00
MIRTAAAAEIPLRFYSYQRTAESVMIRTAAAAEIPLRFDSVHLQCLPRNSKGGNGAHAGPRTGRRPGLLGPAVGT